MEGVNERETPRDAANDEAFLAREGATIEELLEASEEAPFKAYIDKRKPFS